MMNDRLPIDRFRDALDEVGSFVKAKRDDDLMAQCPAHEDRNPSLHVSVGTEGRVLVKCHAGCDTDAVLTALGLAPADLFPPRDEPYVPAATVLEREAVYRYHDADGTVVYEVVRKRGKQFRQRQPDGTWNLRGVDRVPYRLPQLVASDGGVFVVEGEKDADRLADLGLTATTNPGGAGKFDARYAHWFAGRDVAIIGDNDKPGRDHALQVATILSPVAASVRIVDLPGLPDKGDVSDWLAAGHDIDELRTIARTTDAVGTAEISPDGDGPGRHPPLDWHALWNSDADQVDWIVDGIVETGRAAAIFAPGKTGKSLIMLELAACVAAGRPFAGQDVPQPRTVVYVDWENSPGDVLSRLKSLGFGPDDLGRLVYLSLPMLPPLDTEPGGQQLADVVDHHGADLVVLDTVARAVDGPEDASDTIRDYYRHTGQRLKAAGVAVWRIDHAGKDATRGARGSSAKADDVDAVWKLTSHGNGRLHLKLDRRRTLHGVEELHLVRAGSGRLHATAAPRTDYQEAVDAIVRALDDADIPLDWGRRKATPALREAGVTARNELIGAAITLRREAAETPAVTVLEAVPESGPHEGARGPVWGPVEGGPATGPGPVGDRSGPPGPVSGGTGGPHTPRPIGTGVGTGPPHPAGNQGGGDAG